MLARALQAWHWSSSRSRSWFVLTCGCANHGHCATPSPHIKSSHFLQVRLDSQAEQAHKEALQRKLLELRTRLDILQPRVQGLMPSISAASEAAPGPSSPEPPRALPQAESRHPRQLQPSDPQAARASISSTTPAHQPAAPEAQLPTLTDVFGSSDEEADDLAAQPGLAAPPPVAAGVKQKLLAQVMGISPAGLSLSG